jgi:hypothetical protein
VNHSRFGLTGFALFLVACSGQKGESTGGGVAAGPTYYDTVKPIIDAKCATCHRDGGIAPFSLTSYEAAKSFKDAIKSAVVARTMPPWPPADGCSEYVSPRSLTTSETDTITSWVGAGAPEGQKAAKSQDPAPQASLSRVDLTLSLPMPYTPKVSPDEYRCFVLDWPETKTKYVTGFGVKPGVNAIVHHVIAFLAKPADVAKVQKLDEDDAGPGYSCFGGPGGGGGRYGWIGGWAPGGQGSDFPAGTGIEIPAGSKVVVQLHYNTSVTQPAPDSTSVLLKVDDAVAKKAFVMPWANIDWVTKQQMPIPANSKDVKHSFSFDPTIYVGYLSGGAFTGGKPITLHSSSLHMHTHGARAVTSIERAGGKGNECLLQIDKWDFHWQGAYGFAKPKIFNPGDKLYLECHWDNPTGNNLNWGEGTGDEMCLSTYYVTE